MRTLRGRPRNVNIPGLNFLDSDGEDSDVSDSDVEPVFFPAVGFEEMLQIEEFPASDDDDDDSSDESLFEVIHPGGLDEVDLALLGDTNNPATVPVNIAATDNHNGDQQAEHPIQFFGGTVQVRHIINESFVQLQQEQMEAVSEDVNGEEDQSLVDTTMDNPGPAPSTGSEVVESEDTKEGRPSTSGPSSTNTNQVENATRQPDLETKAEAGTSSSSHHPVNANNGESANRLSLKRKERVDSDVDDDRDENKEYGDCDSLSENEEAPSRAKPLSRKAAKRDKFSDDEEEETCNPMVSEDEDESEEAFRGDRIGNTVYSERHVLKILMKWIEMMPQYSLEKLVQARDEEKIAEEIIEKEILQLNTEFEEQMALLWDMSAETDVMHFLVENNVFSIIRDTLENSVCNRLIEVSLGILANVISEPSIIEDFTVHDSSLHMVEKVVKICAKVSNVAVLIQAFSVLRRIVWYLRNFCLMKKWTDLLLSPEFLQVSNFIMSSSTNALLLGNVIIFFFAFLDSLNPDGDDDEKIDEEAKSNHASPKETPGSSKETTPDANQRRGETLERLRKSYQPICDSEFVPALCEGLKELMKNPKPPKTRRKLTSTRENPPPASSCNTDEHCLNADDVDVPIPEGHIQQAILKGFSSLALLKKAPNGQNSIKQHADQVVAALLDFYRVFSICSEATTRSDSLEYFTLSLHLLSFCHCNLDSVNMDAILHPVTTASRLINQEERDKEVDMVIRVQLKDGIEFDSVSYIALVIHEYLASVADKFGPECTLKARSNQSHAKMFAVLDNVVSKFTDEEK